MPCPECRENHVRAARAEAAEKSLILFTEMFSKLARELWDLESTLDRRRYAGNPPPDGAAPIRKQRFLLVSADLLGGESELKPARVRKVKSR